MDCGWFLFEISTGNGVVFRASCVQVGIVLTVYIFVSIPAQQHTPLSIGRDETLLCVHSRGVWSQMDRAA